ncbi:serine threonine protein kinase-like protein SNF1p [Byssothecium circinans]|uniref:non-specific serine/threonine protein kinase n=1 Tax=Byssothecium circinans TaxID=147558 RepID=A0A6A5TCI9_9PLEO|nr:serine threonine protein kinase-like protein SNF1p [Byssothecium circinans]
MSAAIDTEDLEGLSLQMPPPRRPSNRPSDMSSTPQAPATAVQETKSPGDPKTTQRLGQYTIVRTLGEGSFGKVKLATHGVSGQKVALKIINRKRLITRDMAGRIEREIQYLQLLRHPHIIKLYTVITSQTEIIMVLEYAGGELFDYIVNHGKLKEEKARKFFQQIVCAVEYCHRHKIVHRDLKPENLLLDENFNVKIADFGLSNIMTDGNFLKTSCGSPNYAAPEVISGKLYAGPEVDVWSCGVILYVLLVGRLPFDDEYIPTLFKKIAAGNYSIPSYLSSGAVDLIKRMLMVNPVHRITVAEIRQDPWFTKDLPTYLRPPPDEFHDTVVDPTKAIDPQSLDPTQPEAVVQKLHETVVGKLGKTMGYGKHDVQEALARDEPSAIKDAYLIVRENQIMKENPLLTDERNFQPFLAQSPPTHDHYHMGSIPQVLASSRPQIIPPPSDSERGRHGSTSSSQVLAVRSPISTIAVLPSSLPDYHKAYMKGQPKPPPQHPDPEGPPLTEEERAAQARRLKPNLRVTPDVGRQRPEPMTSMPAKKPRPTKWQFGIRSRNQPAEAMLAIFKALKAMGADWEVPKIRKAGGESESRSRSGSRESRSRSRRETRSDSRLSSISASSSQDENERSDQERTELKVRNPDTKEPSRGRQKKHYSPDNDFGYEVGEDPWVINARFRKDGMFPPGVAHPSSTHSSRVDLQDPAALRRRSSTQTSYSSLNHVEGITPVERAGSVTSDSTGGYPAPDEAVYIYMSIQLYNIDRDFYVVDFRCAGYERIVANLVREIKASSRSSTSISQLALAHSRHEDGWDDEQGVWRKLSLPSNEPVPDDLVREVREGGGVLRERTEEVGAGRKEGEKRCASPFPFLDVASTLILQLSGE